MSTRVRTVVVLSATLLIAAAVGAAGETARSAGAGAATKLHGAEAVLTVPLDEQLGLASLWPWDGPRHRPRFSERAQELEAAPAPTGTRAEREERDQLRRQPAASRARRVFAQAQLMQSPHGRRGDAEDHEAAEPVSGSRALSPAHEWPEAERSRTTPARARRTSAAFVLALGVGFGGFGLLWIALRVRRARRITDAERRCQERDAGHRPGVETFRIAPEAERGDSEADGVLERHLERSVLDARAPLLRRDDGDDRIDRITPVAARTALAEEPRDVEPEWGVSVRFGRRDDRSDAAQVLAKPLDTRPAETIEGTDTRAGLPNRRAAEETLLGMIAHAGRRTAPLTIAPSDLDHLNRVNDIHAQHKGDEVLADALVAGVRAEDLAARCDGDEFLPAQSHIDVHAGEEACEQSRKLISGVRVAGVPDPTRARFGVAAYPADGADAETLVRTADRALRAAKSPGRSSPVPSRMALAPGSSANWLAAHAACSAGTCSLISVWA